MRKLRGIPVLFILLVLFAATGAFSAAPPEAQLLPEQTAAPACGLTVTPQEPPSFEQQLEPREVSDCFCVTDRLYCRRNYGSGWVCQDEPWCGCVPV